MGFLDIIVMALFVGFVAFFVVGFNRQMLQRGEEKRERYKKLKEKSEQK